MDVNEKLTSLKEKISRTTKFLKELKTLSKACQEITGGDVIAVADGRVPDEAEAEDAVRERQVRHFLHAFIVLLQKAITDKGCNIRV